jgi:tRNA pseudouridine55 synthase
MTQQFRRQWRDIDGIVLLDKPEGPSSNQALQAARRIYNARKAGHTGSLDPFATGMLPLCFGQATKVSGQMLNAAKTYRVNCQLGTQTSTGDPEGEVTQVADVPQLDEASIRRTLDEFTGEIEQVPPMYSALKHQGKRLYELARQGIEVERKPRSVRIFSLALDSFAADSLVLTVHCSKGTYIRTLVQDLAQAWGTVGHAIALRRLSVEPFAESAMISMGELERLRDDESGLRQLLLRPDQALLAMPACCLETLQAEQLKFGQKVVTAETQAGRVRVYGPQEDFIGIGEVDAAGILRPVRLMSTA